MRNSRGIRIFAKIKFKMSETIGSESDKKPRLKFIDMARSIAILLMLEGHFTGSALSKEYKSSEYFLYTVWETIHGITAPLFFTVTGLIFVYLLTANNEINFRKNIRVRKGFKRVIELIFWGYLLQLKLWSMFKAYMAGSEIRLERFFSFHVLQSIGVGIFLLLLVYGLYKWINKGALYWYYLATALLLYFCNAYLQNYILIEEAMVAARIKSNPDYLPIGAHPIIQNMIYGPHSSFGFVKFSGYVLLGGMLGSMIRIYEKNTIKLWFGLSFILIGIFINISIQTIFHSIDHLTNYIGLTENGVLRLNSTYFVRFGQVLAVLGILILIDKYMTIKSKLFLKIGQNTLPIYILHSIILYGGILGIGLNPIVFNKNLPPMLAISISIFFIFVFVLMVKHIEPLERFYLKFLNLFKFKKV